jgi:hypothetical protein
MSKYGIDATPPIDALSELRRHAVLDSYPNPKPVHWVGLPIDAANRKKKPVYSGVIKYFPDALIGVAEVSYDGNEQHNPGQPLHWDRSKSKDQRDALVRHLIESDPDTGEGLYAAKQVAWRALADLQLKIERMRNANTKS